LHTSSNPTIKTSHSPFPPPPSTPSSSSSYLSFITHTSLSSLSAVKISDTLLHPPSNSSDGKSKLLDNFVDYDNNSIVIEEKNNILDNNTQVIQTNSCIDNILELILKCIENIGIIKSSFILLFFSTYMFI
jgi:hypothetical protein